MHTDRVCRKSRPILKNIYDTWHDDNYLHGCGSSHHCARSSDNLLLPSGRKGWGTHTPGVWQLQRAPKISQNKRISCIPVTCFSFQKSVHHYRAFSAVLRHKAERLPTTCTASMQGSHVQESISGHETRRNNAQSQKVLVIRIHKDLVSSGFPKAHFKLRTNTLVNITQKGSRRHAYPFHKLC